MIDVFASAPWYIDHVAPIWRALPPEARGKFHVSARAASSAVGLPHVTTRPIASGDARRPILTMSFGDYRAARASGRTRIAVGQHGAGQSYSNDHPAYPGGRGYEQASLFLVPNETAARRWRERYPGTPVALIGCPKLDTLPDRDADLTEPVVAFSFHWDGPSIAPEMRSAWTYYRTVVPLVAKRHRVIGHAHPRAMSRVSRWYNMAHIEIVPTFTDILRRASVYVCDNSSSMFEFAATGRPVVVLNAPPFRRDVEHGLRFWEASGVGVNVDRADQLAEAVGRAVADPPEVRAARKAATSIVYQPLRGGAAIAVRALLDWSR